MARVERKIIGFGTEVARVTAAIPAGLPPLLRRFWNFAQRIAKSFSHHLLHPEEKEEEFLERVRKYF